MPTYEQIKADIDTRITNKFANESIGQQDISIPMKVIVDKVQEVAGINAGSVPILANVSSLEGFEGEADLVFVQGPQGGFFVIGEGSVNGGTVFNRASGQQWIRVYDGNRINAKWFGALGNGLQDDLPYLQACAEFCGKQKRGLTMYIPNGVYRITDTWLIGSMLVPNIQELIDYQYVNAPSLSYGYEDNTWRPFIIEFDFDANIHGDFSSASELKAIIYACIRHNTGSNNGQDEKGFSIINPRVYGQGSFVGMTESNSLSYNLSKNQVGLVFVDGFDGVWDNVSVKNMKYGMISNMSYNYRLGTLMSNFCSIPWIERGSNCGVRDCIKAFNYEIGMLLMSSQITVTPWIEGPNTAIWIKYGQGVVINGFYNESLHRVPGNNKFTVEIGCDADDPYYSNNGCNGIVFNGAFLTAGYEGSSLANAIKLRASARTVTFIASQILGHIETTNTDNRLLFSGAWWRAGNYSGTGFITLMDGKTSDYANNAAAVTAGLRSGTIYHTSGSLKIVT